MVFLIIFASNLVHKEKDLFYSSLPHNNTGSTSNIFTKLITASKSVYVQLPSSSEFAETQISQNQRLLFNQVKVNFKNQSGRILNMN